LLMTRIIKLTKNSERNMKVVFLTKSFMVPFIEYSLDFKRHNKCLKLVIQLDKKKSYASFCRRRSGVQNILENLPMIIFLLSGRDDIGSVLSLTTKFLPKISMKRQKLSPVSVSA
jgi:hypothetical protein